MRTYEINLTHGEVEVTIEMGDKTIASSYGSTDFTQEMFVTMVDSFDDITLQVSAFLSGDLRPEWVFNRAELFELSCEAADLEDAKAMATELIDNHEFLDGLTEAFYR